MAEEEPEKPKVEVVPVETKGGVQEVATAAVEALGLGDVDLPELLKEIMGANEEDRRWRAEVLRRLDILVNNQRLIHESIVGEYKIVKKAKE